MMNSSGVVLHNLNVVPFQFLCHAAAAEGKKILSTVCINCPVSFAMYILYIYTPVYTGCFFNWYAPKKLKYGKPRLGESTAT